MENNNEYNEIKCTVLEGERVQFVTLDEWLRVEIKHGRITDAEIKAVEAVLSLEKPESPHYAEPGITVGEVMENLRIIQELQAEEEGE